MSTHPRPTEQNEQDSLAIAMDEYLRLCESGNSPDRESFLNRFSSIRTELADCLDGLEMIEQMTPEFQCASSPNSESAEKPLLSALGDFRIVRELGRGGMGVVFEAEQLSLGRRVALKVLPFASLLDNRQLDRFKNEARAAALLKHPNIVSVFQTGYDRGVHYYAMELIEGRSLADEIADLRSRGISYGPADAIDRDPCELEANRDTGRAIDSKTAQSKARKNHFRNVVRLGIQAADALDYAHQTGVVHRDIKPSNLLIDRHGSLHVTDFGLARIQKSDHLTQTGDVVGTLRYMSPEQLDGRVADERSDIYSLGVTLYESLALRPAYDAEERHKLIQEIAAKPIQSVEKVCPDIPHDLATVIQKCIQKPADMRYQSAAALSEDLRRFSEHRPVLARRPSRKYYAWSWIKRNPIIALLTTAIAVLLLASAIGGAVIAFQKSELLKQLEQNQHVLVHNEQRLLAEAYDKDISIAYSALENGDFERVDKLLNRHLPQSADATDYRSFEWRYLWHQSRRGIETPQRKLATSAIDMAISRDGQFLAIASFSGGVHMLDGRTATTRWKGPHLPMPCMVAIAHDRRLVATAEVLQSSISFIDCTSGDLITTNDFEHNIKTLAFSPNKNILAIGFDNSRQDYYDPSSIGVYRWIWNKGRDNSNLELELLHHFEEIPGGVNCIDLSSDGQRLAVGCHSPNVMLWDLESGEQLPVLSGKGRAVSAVAFSPTDSSVIAAATTSATRPNSPGEVLVWDLETHESDLLLAHDGGTEDVCFSPNGKKLATCGIDRIIRVWDLERLAVIETIRGHSAAVRRVEFTPDGQTLISCSTDTSVRFWNFSASKNPDRFDAHNHFVYALDFDKHGTKLISTGFHRPFASIQEHDLSTGASRAPFQTNVESAYDIDVSPDGNTVAVSGGTYGHDSDGESSLWDLKSGRKKWTLASGPFIWASEFSPDGSKVVSGVMGKLVFCDTATGKQVDEWDVSTGRIKDICWTSRDVIAISILGEQSGLALWEAKTKTKIWEYNGKNPLDELFTIAISRDHHWLAASSIETDHVCLWRLGENHTPDSPARTLEGHTDNIFGIDFSPDGQRLVSASKDGTLRLWNLNTATELISFRDHQGWCFPCKFSPDGKILAAGIGDISIWDGGIRLYRSD